MTWMPGWEQERGESAGTWATGSRHPKLVLHAIEGRSAQSAFQAYKANRSWPHATVDPVRRLRWQHVPLNAPARALRNKSGGVETGRAPIVIQVEIVGFAGESHTWDPDDLDWLGSDVVGPLCRTAGIPIRSDVTFYGEGAGWVLASDKARQRLSGPAWLAYEGVLGHQHVPENTHWDPGALDIDRILAAATASKPPSEEDDMPLNDADKRFIQDTVNKAIAAIWTDEASDAKVDEAERKRDGSLKGWVVATAKKVGVTRAEAIAEDPAHKG